MLVSSTTFYIKLDFFFVCVCVYFHFRSRKTELQLASTDAASGWRLERTREKLQTFSNRKIGRHKRQWHWSGNSTLTKQNFTFLANCVHKYRSLRYFTVYLCYRNHLLKLCVAFHKSNLAVWILVLMFTPYNCKRPIAHIVCQIQVVCLSDEMSVIQLNDPSKICRQLCLHENKRCHRSLNTVNVKFKDNINAC